MRYTAQDFNNVCSCINSLMNSGKHLGDCHSTEAARAANDKLLVIEKEMEAQILKKLKLEASVMYGVKMDPTRWSLAPNKRDNATHKFHIIEDFIGKL